MMTDLGPVIRRASMSDAPAIARIYNEGIADRIATFETDPRSAADIEQQLRERGDHFPTIVIEVAGSVVAWAGVGKYRDRACYAGIGEHSVYVGRDARGQGYGLLALDALCAACADQGLWKLVSRILPENVASLALHERAGFRVVGTYQRHGKLDGEWRDCVIVEKLLDPDTGHFATPTNGDIGQ